ncbi:hypothetical protein niasHS_008351 [Heterodera schachtii]|uniref:Uncharacterized protein n=1 Tax=Heterodera schachtii TaxID=97005 RepID=A0ABD2JCP3_HETSC
MPSQTLMPSALGSVPSTSPSGSLSPKSRELKERKQIKELARLREMIMQGFLIMQSLLLRFVGFFVLPWLAFAAGANGIDQRALICVLANTLILLSLISHSLIYWWWNSKIRELCKEVVETLHKKLLQSR